MRTLLKSLCSLAVLLQLGAVMGGELESTLSIAMADHTVPAMGITLIRHGQIAGQAVRGVRAAGGSDAVQRDDVWNIGSDGKAMTATLIARLVEQGKLSWHTPLKTLLPDLAKGMRAQYRDVDLEDLLSHRAGLPRNADEKWLESFYDDVRPMHEQRMDLLKRALSEAPVAPAHKDANYSNSGPIIAATIAEIVTGKSYEELMQSEVFQPLGMKAGFGPTVPGQNLGHGEGKPVTGVHAGNPAVMTPAGEIHLSINDWALFAVDQMEGEHNRGKLLKATSYRYLHSPKGKTASALGWGVRDDKKNGKTTRVIMHAGSNGFWNAVIALVPESQDGVLITANASDGTDIEARQIAIVREILPTFNTTK